MDDTVAEFLCGVCLTARIKVPEEIAILGIGDEDTECKFAPIPLSSVTLPGERVGYESMALLEKMLNGATAPAEPILIPPLGVTMRSSTRNLVLHDPYVEEVVNYIHSHATSPISIAEVTSHISLSRRALEERFKTERGHTMSDEIHHARVQHARRLLLETDLSIDVIATDSGFANRPHFARIFKRIIGVTPPVFRKGARGK